MITQEMESLDRRGYACFSRGLYLAAREHLELWCRVVRTREPSRACEALNALGSVYVELGDTSRALELFTQSLEWEPAGSDIDRVRSLCNISLCCYLMGRGADCVSYGERAFERLRRIGSADPMLEAHVREILSLGYIAVGEWEKAAEAGESARAAFEAIGDTAGIAKVLNNLGVIHIESGRFDEAESLLRASLALMESVQDRAAAAYTYTELGRLCYKRKDVSGALRFGSKALRLIWENMGLIDKAEIARLCELFGSIAYGTGDRQSAVAHLQRASTYYAQQDRWREWQSSNEELNKVIAGGPCDAFQRIAIDVEDRRILRYFTTLLGLLDTLDCLYPSLRGKSELVTKYALLLGSERGVEGQDLERLSHAARLHDIGLTSMNPGPGRSGGTAQIDDPANPVFGERVLKTFGVHVDVQKAVRHRREWFSGEGGPDGLRGEEIPLFARIIAVAEAYVAAVMAEPDPCRSHSVGMAAVRAESGRRLDPELIEAFVRMHES